MAKKKKDKREEAPKKESLQSFLNKMGKALAKEMEKDLK